MPNRISDPISFSKLSSYLSSVVPPGVKSAIFFGGTCNKTERLPPWTLILNISAIATYLRFVFFSLCHLWAFSLFGLMSEAYGLAVLITGITPLPLTNSIIFGTLDLYGSATQ